MLKELEDQCDQLKVESFGITITTMEEVFTKISNDVDRELLITDQQSYENDLVTYKYDKDKILLTGFPLIKCQMLAMFKKKYLQTIRKWWITLFQILIPIVFTTMTITASRETAYSNDLPAMPIAFDSYSETVTVLETNPKIDSTDFAAK